MKKAIAGIYLVFGLGMQVEAQVGAATVALQDGKLDKAKTAIDKAILDEKDAKKSKTWFTRGEVYTQLTGSPIPQFVNLDKKAPKVAFEAYQKAMELEPAKRGYYTDAQKALQEKLYPFAINRGVNTYKTKDYESSLEAFDIAMAIKPTDTVAIYYAQAVSWEAKNYDKFISYSEQMSKMPFQAATIKQTNMQLSYLYAGEKKDYKKAIEILEKEVNKSPKDYLLWQLLAEYYEVSTNAETKIKFYEKAVMQFPNDFGFNRNLGYAHFNKGVEINKDIMKKKEAEGLTGNLKDPKKIEKAKAYNALLDEELKKAIPYLEAAHKAKADDFDTMDLLRTCYDSLDMKAKKEEMDKKIKAMGK